MYTPFVTFKKIITLLHSTNMVIGGKVALKLHGLNMSQAPADLDLIIFNPDMVQMEVLEHMAPFDIINDRPQNPDYPTNMTNIKAMKFKKDNQYLDIIIAREPVPDRLLSVKILDVTYLVNSVQNVIDAKNSYYFNRKESGGPAKYARAKDFLDLLDLKNMNFNADTERKSD